MKKTIKALAAHSKLLSKSLAAARYLKKDTAYWESQQLIAYFADTDKRNDHRYIRKLTLDMMSSRFYNQISLEEYFLFQFEDKSAEERHAYIGDDEQQWLCDQIGDAENRRLLEENKSILDCVSVYPQYMFGKAVWTILGIRAGTQILCGINEIIVVYSLLAWVGVFVYKGSSETVPCILDLSA